jgi:hypothetical protein
VSFFFPDNKAPIVSPNLTERIITVNINSTWTINLTDYVTDDNTSPENFVFDVATNLTKDEYYIGNDNIYFKSF